MSIVCHLKMHAEKYRQVPNPESMEGCDKRYDSSGLVSMLLLH